MKNQITLPIILSDRKIEIEIKDTTLTGLESIKFRSLVDLYFDTLSEEQSRILEAVKDSEQVIFQTKKSQLEEQRKQATAISDTRLRESKLEKINQETEELQLALDQYQAKCFENSESVIATIRKNQKEEKTISKISSEYKLKKYEKEVEICKLLCTYFDEEKAKMFNFTKLSALAPFNLIEAVLENKENVCNDFFTKWSAIKNQAAVPSQN